MNKIVCEMCGSADMVKQDGFVVCQHCGMKYSPEEIKEMLIKGRVEVEGVVQVQGQVQVQNAAQLESLLKLAETAYASKNYAQAESFCDQAIAMDSKSYTAWKIKGEAINYQITGANDRITEVYNCIMTSYDVLPEDQKDAHREEILASLRTCLEGEIDFALQLFMENRPSDAMLQKVQDTFLKCASDVITSYEKLGYDEAAADEYRTYIKDYFAKQVISTCNTTWEKVVYYNYNRDGWNDEFHPTQEIFNTYVEEGNNLVNLLAFSAKYFSDNLPGQVKINNYKTRNIILEELQHAQCYKRMVSTTTNGYGAVISRREYWQKEYTLGSSAVQAMQDCIAANLKVIDTLENMVAMENPQERQRMLAQWKSERAALDLKPKITGTQIFAVLVWAAMSAASFIWLPGWAGGGSFGKWFGIICGGIFGMISLFGLIGTVISLKQKKEKNIAEAARLDKKIQQFS